MSKEYEPIISVQSQDSAPPQDTLTDDFTVVSAWTVVHNMTSAAVSAISTVIFSSAKCMKIAYTATALGNYATIWRALPFNKQHHVNFEFALGWGQVATSGDISFVVGQIDNNGAVLAMKFKILAWGTTSSALQYWNATTNAWVTITTLTFANIVAGQFITIKGKFDPIDGDVHELQVGSLSYSIPTMPLETEIGQVFNSGLATPGYNMGIFGIEITNATAATALITYIDRIRVFGSSL